MLLLFLFVDTMLNTTSHIFFGESSIKNSFEKYVKSSFRVKNLKIAAIIRAKTLDGLRVHLVLEAFDRPAKRATIEPLGAAAETCSAFQLNHRFQNYGSRINTC